MQGAHDVLVALGHLTERALVQAEPAAVTVSDGLRREPDLRQGRGQHLDRLSRVKPLIRRRLLGQVAAPFPARLLAALNLLTEPARLHRVWSVEA